MDEDEGLIVEMPAHAAIMYHTEKPADGRDFLATMAGTVHWALTDELHQWLADRNQDYDLGIEKSGLPNQQDYRWLVWIPDSRVATLFKLTFA